MPLDLPSKAVLDAFNASGLLPFRRHTHATIRDKVLALRKLSPPSSIDMARVSEQTITAPGGDIRVRILNPAADGVARPALIYLHGGGYFMGGIDESDDLCRRLATGAGVVVFNVEYHLSPEAKFPVAVEDAYAALCWVEANAAAHGADPLRIAIAGDSAGGNLAIVTCLMTRERRGPRIAFQVPIYPSLDLRPRPYFASREAWGGGGYLLDSDDIEWMLDHYLNDRSEGLDWRATPLVASSFAGLPPALVVTAGHDPLKDEGRFYAERLNADGVAAEHACFETTFHGFISYAALVPAGAQGVDLICDRLRQALAA